MIQPIFAIIAFMLLSLVIYSERRNTVQAQTIMVEQTINSNGVAVSRLNVIPSYGSNHPTEDIYLEVMLP